MAKKYVYITKGLHWYIPGQPVSVCPDRVTANHEAADLVRIMHKELNLSGTVTASNWEERLKDVKNAIAKGGSDAECDVWIDRQTVLKSIKKKG